MELNEQIVDVVHVKLRYRDSGRTVTIHCMYAVPYYDLLEYIEALSYFSPVSTTSKIVNGVEIVTIFTEK